MKYTDLAEYVGPTPNCNPGQMGAVLGLCLHVTEGNLDGSISWAKNPASKISFHFGNGKGGRFVQVVDTADEAWAEAAGNPNWISLENEGNSGDMLTPAQISNAAKLLHRLHQDHGVPFQISDHPDTPGLGYHSMGGVPWGDHPDCPGTPIIGQRELIIQAAEGLSHGPVPYPGTPVQQGSTGEEVREVQARLIARGYACGPWGADGKFGRATAAAVGAFQKAFPECQSIRRDGTPDEIVGPHTWEVLFS
jgi:N-acetyl-anhydromuramyl-L-alanine amidase AmpD